MGLSTEAKSVIKLMLFIAQNNNLFQSFFEKNFAWQSIEHCKKNEIILFADLMYVLWRLR